MVCIAQLVVLRHVLCLYTMRRDVGYVDAAISTLSWSIWQVISGGCPVVGAGAWVTGVGAGGITGCWLDGGGNSFDSPFAWIQMSWCVLSALPSCLMLFLVMNLVWVGRCSFVFRLANTVGFFIVLIIFLSVIKLLLFSQPCCYGLVSHAPHRSDGKIKNGFVVLHHTSYSVLRLSCSKIYDCSLLRYLLSRDFKILAVWTVLIGLGNEFLCQCSIVKCFCSNDIAY